jgi:hypothetical protein
VQKIGIKLTSGVSGDLVKVSLHDGATKVGEAYFIGASTSAITTLSQSVQVPKDNDKVITIKADFASIGTGQAVNHSGDLVQVDFLNGAGVGANSGGAISISGATATAGVRVMKTYPTVALHTGGLPVGGLADGRLMRFAVTADAHGPVGLTQLFVSVAPSGFSSGGISRLNVYGYSDSSYSNPIAGVSPSGAFLATDACPSGCASNTLVVSASRPRREHQLQSKYLPDKPDTLRCEVR